MRVLIFSLSFLSFFDLSSTAATPVEFAPTCGTTLYPVILQQILEARPFQVLPNNHNFHVSQEIDLSGAVHNRRYQIVGFENIPAKSSLCQLNFQFPTEYNITTSGTAALNVKTLFNGDSSKIQSPNYWTWNKFYPEISPPFGSVIFGTTSFIPGTTSAINSEGCPAGGGNLAFVFEIADWVLIDGSVEFKQANGGGVYLTYDC